MAIHGSNVLNLGADVLLMGWFSFGCRTKSWWDLHEGDYQQPGSLGRAWKSLEVRRLLLVMSIVSWIARRSSVNLAISADPFQWPIQWPGPYSMAHSEAHFVAHSVALGVWLRRMLMKRIITRDDKHCGLTIAIKTIANTPIKSCWKACAIHSLSSCIQSSINCQWLSFSGFQSPTTSIPYLLLWHYWSRPCFLLVLSRVVTGWHVVLWHKTSGLLSLPTT